MAIHQIQFAYQEQQDRVLMRVSTMEGEEFRFWLTRRFVKQLWGMLVRMLESDQAVRQQSDEGTRRTVLEIQHEGFARQGDFSREFEDAPRQLPLGEAPVMLASAKGAKGGDGIQVISLLPSHGPGIDLTLDTKLLHIFSKLLQDAVARADWDIKLALYEGAQQDTADQPITSQKLN